MEKNNYPTCDSCGWDGGQWPLKFYYPEGFRGPIERYCKNCHPQRDLFRPHYAHLHMKVPHAGDTNLTYAKDEVIINRVISPDDGKTVIDRRTGKESEY